MYSDFVERAFAITKSDTTVFEHPTTFLYVGTAGNIKVKLVGGDVITFNSLTAGVFHPIRAMMVYSTDTAASGIVGVY